MDGAAPVSRCYPLQGGSSRGQMDFSSEHYFKAALERIGQAEFLYRAGDCYALTMYVAGVAVESMLRAYRVKKKQGFESRHDVMLLFKKSGMLDVDPDRLRAKGLSAREIEEHLRVLRTTLNDVYLLWHNNYRYASESRLLAHLKRMKLYQGAKGDPLKAKALQLLDAAQVFVEKGVLQWQ